jgi:rRNA maturation endonuclease Nob1
MMGLGKNNQYEFDRIPYRSLHFDREKLYKAQYHCVKCKRLFSTEVTNKPVDFCDACRTKGKIYK